MSLPRVSLRVLIALVCAHLVAALALAQLSGPLEVSETNPRYLVDGTGQVVVLVGSHDWGSFQDYVGPVAPNCERDNIPFEQFAATIAALGHSFTRGWHWEDTYYTPGPYRQSCGNDYDLGTPLNSAYRTRVKNRLEQAEEVGLYTSVMLFQGWSVWHPNRTPHPWPLKHPYHEDNNCSGVDATEGPKTHELHYPAATLMQEGYVRALVQDLNGYDNFIWEITNESHPESRDWQYHMIGVILDEESSLPNKHPIWMSCSGSTGDLFMSEAEIISPCKGSGYSVNDTNPPENQGLKVILADSDHLDADDANPVWAWKSFMRGLQPLFMDRTNHLEWWDKCDDWVKNKQEYLDLRQALGAIRDVSKDVDLSVMAPQPKGSVTPPDAQYVLFSTDEPWSLTPSVNGHEFLVYLEKGNVQTRLCGLIPGADYEFQWTHGINGTQEPAAGFQAEGSCRSFWHSGGASRALRVTRPAVPPVAVIATQPEPPIGPVPFTVDFDGSGSYDLDGTIEWNWIFPGGGASGPTAQYTFDTPGSWVVTLEVKDNDGLEDTAEVTVEAGVGASVTVDPESRFVPLGTDVDLSVEAEGDPQLNYEWFKDGVALVDDGRVTGTATANLQIAGFGAADAGSYYCVVSNAFESATSSAARLMVLGAGAVVRDTFYRGTSPSALNGRVTEAGGGVWEANSKLLVRQTDEVSSRDSVSEVHGIGGVPYDAATLGLVSRLEADVLADESTQVSVGFSSTATGLYTTDGQLWVRLKTATTEPFYRVRVNGNEQVGGGPIPGYEAGVPGHVAIEHDPLLNTLAVWINGEAVPLSGQSEAGPLELDFTPNVQYAGIDIQNGTQSTTSVDNFEVKVVPALVRDTFYRGTSPSALNGRVTEAGGGVWEANSKLLVRQTDEVSSRDSVSEVHGIGGVPYDATALGLVSRLEADVLADESTQVSVGFSSTATGLYTTDGQLWVRLKTATTEPFYRVRVNGNEQVGGGPIPGYEAGVPDHVAIEHDPLLNTLAVWINGEAVPLSGQSEAGPLELDFTPNVQYAGIDIQNGTQSTTSVDNFEVKVVPALVRDTFYRGTSPSALNGRVTEAGGGVWEANSKLLVRQTDEVSSRDSVSEVHGIGGVPYDATALGLVSRLEADVLADESTQVSVGFSSTATGLYTTDGQLWVRLKTATTEPFYRVRVNGNEQVGGGPIPGYEAGVPDHVAIEHDPLLNTLAVWINGEAVPLSGQSEAGPLELDFTPNVQYAGIDIQNGTQSTTSVDNFEVLVK